MKGSTSSIVRVSNQLSWRNSNAARTSLGKIARKPSSLSRSFLKLGGSWKSTGPSRGPIGHGEVVAVWTDQANDFARGNLQVDIVNGDGAFIALGQSACFNDIIHQELPSFSVAV